MKTMDATMQDVCREEPAPTGVAFERLLTWLDDGVDSHGRTVTVMSSIALTDRSRRCAYGPSLHRLREIKTRWDPDHFFRPNVNIQPQSGNAT